jgi:hypothetical protein
MGIYSFFANKGAEAEEGAVIEAPAFSITKVMAAVAPLLTAGTTWAVSTLGDTKFNSGQISAIIIALIGFLAVTGAADVLARAVATAAEKRSTVGRMVPLEKPIEATIDRAGRDEIVSIYAVSDFLVLRDGDKFTIESAKSVHPR